MLLTTISADAWREFVDRWPDAQSFLLGASLAGEKKAPQAELELLLPSENKRRIWIASRLAELRNIED